MTKMTSDQNTHVGWFVINLSAMIFTGVCALLWVLLYTENFVVIGGLLGLGGVLAWIAFMANLIRDDRKEALQRLFDEVVLQKPITLVCTVLLAIGFLVTWPFRFGTVVVDSAADGVHRTLKVFETNADGSATKLAHKEITLAPGATLKVPVSTGILGTNVYRFKLSGLPATDVRLGFLDREPLTVPASFQRRPLVLVRPSPLDSANLTAVPAEFVAFRNDVEIGRLKDYRGDAVWIGADVDVPVPEEVKNDWRLALRRIPGVDEEVVFSRWLPPRSVAAGLAFAVGDRIKIVVRDLSNGKVLGEKTLRVQAIGLPRDIVQDVMLDGLKF